MLNNVIFSDAAIVFLVGLLMVGIVGARIADWIKGLFE